jgi:hypothetical protein
VALELPVGTGHNGTVPSGMAVPGGVAPAEAAEIEAMFASVDADRHALALRLSLKLGPLVQRGVPPRVLEAAPVAKAARLRFADGTTVVVKGTSPGDLAVLAMAMQHGSLRPTACRPSPDGGAQLQLRSPDGQHRLSIRVVGLDQPD